MLNYYEFNFISLTFLFNMLILCVTIIILINYVEIVEY